jgi:hypothetical protein
LLIRQGGAPVLFSAGRTGGAVKKLCLDGKVVLGRPFPNRFAVAVESAGAGLA